MGNGRVEIAQRISPEPAQCKDPTTGKIGLEDFLRDMEPHTSPVSTQTERAMYSIERIGNDGNTPENCRWAKQI
jgi:hypothetical protein